jgi:AAA domain
VTATSASEGAGKWTPDLNEWFRDRTAYILPDNDGSGAKHAEQVACSLAGIAREVRIVNLPGLAAGDDVYDWIKRGGTREQLDELGGAASTFQATEEPAQARESGGLGDDRARSGDAPKRGRFELTRLDAIQIDDGAVYQIDGLLPAGPAFGLVVGLPKSLKSFLLMRAGLCIAAGLPFAGREVKQGAVVLITSEGLRGVKRRLIAMRKALGIEGKDVPFFLISAMPDLGTGTDDLKILIAEIEKALAGCGYSLAMVIIDTVRRATPGKDENSAKDMGGYIQNVDAIATRFRCIVMSVHHSPRGGEGRGSGSNALDGAADIIWVITREGASPTATATVAWMKDGEGEGTSWTFTLRTDVEIGRNQTDQPIFGCTVDITDSNEPDSADKADKNKKPPWERGSLPTFKLALTDLLLAHGTLHKPYSDDRLEVRTVDADRVRTEFLKRYAADGKDEASRQEAKATAWRRALKDATQKYQLVGTREVEGVQLLWFARDEKPSP